MDKYINKWKEEGGTNAFGLSAGVKKPGRQQRLEDLAKVHILQSSSNNPRLEEIVLIRTGIEQALTQADAEQQLLKHLRHLACFELTHELIVDSQIGPLMRQLKESTSPDVARMAGNIVEKLRKVVKRQARTLSSQPPQRPHNKLGSATNNNNVSSSSGRTPGSGGLQAQLRPSLAAKPSSSAPAVVHPTPGALPGSSSAGSAQPTSNNHLWGGASMPAWGEGGASTNSYPVPASNSQAGAAVGFGHGVLQQGQLPPQPGTYHQPLMAQGGAWPALQPQQQQQQYNQHTQPAGMQPQQFTQPHWAQQQQQSQASSLPTQQHLPAIPVQSSNLSTASAAGSGGVAGRWMQRKKVPGRAIVIE